jgi:hypothetical protein
MISALTVSVFSILVVCDYLYELNSFNECIFIGVCLVDDA